MGRWIEGNTPSLRTDLSRPHQGEKSGIRANIKKRIPFAESSDQGILNRELVVANPIAIDVAMMPFPQKSCGVALINCTTEPSEKRLAHHRKARPHSGTRPRS